MNSLLIKSLQLEYETSPITMLELCNKHQVSEVELLGSEKWMKTPSLPMVINNNDDDEEDEAIEVDKDTVFIDSLRETALLVLDSVSTSLSQDDLTPRDLKDLSSALATLRDTVVGKPQPQNISVTNIQSAIVNYAQMQLKRVEADC